MIYKILTGTMSKAMPQTDNSLPTTVEEVMASTSTSTDHDEGITVLDLSNPKDVAMVTEAGYSIVDLSASMSSTVSELSGGSNSSDTLSMVTEDYMSDLDPEIARATLQAQESGSLIPLIKEELKYSIQKKRLQEGKEPILVDLTHKKRRNEELSAEEEERRKRRRERNKIAAQKCRNKRKDVAETLEQESVSLEQENEDLRDQIEQLESEKETLRNMLRTHDICPRTCNTRLSACSDDESLAGTAASHGVPSAAARAGSSESGLPDPAQLDVQLELEISDQPVESPFCVELMGLDDVEDQVIL